MSSLTCILPDVPEKLALYESDDSFLRWVDETEARQLIKAGEVELLRTKRKLRALRYRAGRRIVYGSRQTSEPSYSASGRGIPAGTPHRNENYYNVRGVWHFDRIPPSQSMFFRAILCDRTYEPAA